VTRKCQRCSNTPSPTVHDDTKSTHVRAATCTEIELPACRCDGVASALGRVLVGKARSSPGELGPPQAQWRELAFSSRGRGILGGCKLQA
jgi:hypothetical protein